MAMLFPYMKRHIGKLALGALLLFGNSFVAVLPAVTSQILFDYGFIERDLSQIAICCLLLVMISVIHSALSMCAVRIISQVGETVISDMRVDMTNMALLMPSATSASLGTGYILSRIDEVGKVGSIFSSTNLMFLGSVAQAVFAFIFLIDINWQVAIISLIPTCLFLLVGRLTTRAYRDVLRASLETRASFSGKVNECLSGRDEIVLNEGLDREREGISNLSNQLKAKGIRQSIVLNGASEVYQVLNVLASGSVYLICGMMMVSGFISIGQIVAISQYVSKVYSPIVLFSTTAIAVQPAFEALARLEKLFGGFDEENSGVENRIDEVDSLSVSDLNFSYPGSREPLIRDLSFSISSPGLCVVHGRNGGGKTTLARLILGLMTGYEGSIKINGIELAGIDSKSLRSVSSMVNQSPFLFNSSIKENVTYGNSEVSQDRYDEISQVVGIDEICCRFSIDGKDKVGESGALLSSGERQRISLARALLRESSLVVFDEPTSGLDNESLLRLRETVDGLAKKSLVVVIDHTGAFDDMADVTVNL